MNALCLIIGGFMSIYYCLTIISVLPHHKMIFEEIVNVPSHCSILMHFCLEENVISLSLFSLSLCVQAEHLRAERGGFYGNVKRSPSGSSLLACAECQLDNQASCND